MIKTTLLSLCVLFALAIGAAAQVVVTPTNFASLGWSTADTRPGGAVNFVVDGTAPSGVGALQLTTDATTTAKAQFLHAANVPLSQVSQLSYSTKQNSASFVSGDPSYQLPVCLGGFNDPVTTANPSGCSGFTTLVYEPYQGGGGAVVSGTWQSWNTFTGLWWSSRSYSSGTCIITGSAGGPAIYTIGAVSSACPNAVAVGFGVNIGSNNPSYNVETDLVNFNGTTYDFEPFLVAKTQDQCKKDGWKSAFRADGSGFKNQGDCIQYVNTGK